MLISKSKKYYLRSYFKENSKNSKEAWTKINQLLQKKMSKVTSFSVKKD